MCASGFGGWAVVAGSFIFIQDEWTSAEVAKFSINVLETLAKDIFGAVALAYAQQTCGLSMTHSMAFVDNSTAQHVSENGRTQVEAIAFLNLRRQEWLRSHNLHETTERVASIAAASMSRRLSNPRRPRMKPLWRSST